MQILDNIHGSKTWEDIGLKIQNCLQFAIYQVMDSVKVELKQENVPLILFFITEKGRKVLRVVHLTLENQVSGNLLFLLYDKKKLKKNVSC